MLERRVLEDAGFLVEEVRRGDRALQSLESLKIAVVLLDYRLPDMTGADVVAALGERIRSLPVVMVTGNAQPELMDEMLGAGIAGYLIKDAELGFLKQLPAMLEAVLERFGSSTVSPESCRPKPS